VCRNGPTESSLRPRSAILKSFAFLTKLLPRKQGTHRQELMLFILFAILVFLCGHFVFGCGLPRCEICGLNQASRGRKTQLTAANGNFRFLRKWRPIGHPGGPSRAASGPELQPVAGGTLPQWAVKAEGRRLKAEGAPDCEYCRISQSIAGGDIPDKLYSPPKTHGIGESAKSG
jgi:hypothetical protein